MSDTEDNEVKGNILGKMFNSNLVLSSAGKAKAANNRILEVADFDSNIDSVLALKRVSPEHECGGAKKIDTRVLKTTDDFHGLKQTIRTSRSKKPFLLEFKLVSQHSCVNAWLIVDTPEEVSNDPEPPSHDAEISKMKEVLTEQWSNPANNRKVVITGKYDATIDRLPQLPMFSANNRAPSFGSPSAASSSDGWSSLGSTLNTVLQQFVNPSNCNLPGYSPQLNNASSLSRNAFVNTAELLSSLGAELNQINDFAGYQRTFDREGITLRGLKVMDIATLTSLGVKTGHAAEIKDVLL
ncbi:hypothetical protein HDU99_003802 [Rhizoclosmatium hyalinum]|nr:hypothetical protein HDU99_003802 [Rhizoclosmatium hyalinum]